MKNKNIFCLFGGIFILVLVVGVSYAYWSLTFTQNKNNVVMSDCFEIEFLEGNAINLFKAYPISDEEGLQSIPYTFTIKNVCEGSATYQINLESLEVSGKKLPEKSLKVNLTESNESKITSKLESSLETEATIEGALSAYQLLVGELRPKEEKEFSLRIWMHSDVTASDKDSMNAIYNGKISVITSYALTTLVDTIQLLPKVTEGTGLYEVSHSDANITYTNDANAIQNLKQTELRYAGANPNNYVEFNGELWRMIGLVNTPEGQRIKLIRKEGIGSYSWDSSESGINSGNGVNEWSTSKVMHLLNDGAYYNRSSGTCYNGQNNVSIACDFSSTGLTSEAKEMIDRVTWNTGSSDGTTYTYTNINPNVFYNLERSSYTGKICSGSSCNDTVTRTTSWVGEVGLMYPSDYGYATSGGTNTNRTTCLNTYLYSWDGSGVSDCKTNDWLHNSNDFYWTLTSVAFSSYVFNGNITGAINSNLVSNAFVIQPSIYLKPDIKVSNGIGTIDFPYMLQV